MTINNTNYTTIDYTSLLHTTAAHGMLALVSEIYDPDFTSLGELSYRNQKNINSYLNTMMTGIGGGLDNLQSQFQETGRVVTALGNAVDGIQGELSTLDQHFVTTVNGNSGPVTITAASLGLAGAYVFKGNANSVADIVKKATTDNAQNGWVYNDLSTEMNYAILKKDTGLIDFANSTKVPTGGSTVQTIANFVTATLGMNENVPLQQGVIYHNDNSSITINEQRWEAGSLKIAVARADGTANYVIAVRTNHDGWKLLTCDTSNTTILKFSTDLGYDAYPKDGVANTSYGVFYCNTLVAGYQLDPLGSTFKADVATTSSDGLMSKEDKTKLNGIEAGATKGITIQIGTSELNSKQYNTSKLVLGTALQYDENTEKVNINVSDLAGSGLNGDYGKLNINYSNGLYVSNNTLCVNAQPPLQADGAGLHLSFGTSSVLYYNTGDNATTIRYNSAHLNIEDSDEGSVLQLNLGKGFSTTDNKLNVSLGNGLSFNSSGAITIDESKISSLTWK